MNFVDIQSPKLQIIVKTSGHGEEFKCFNIYGLGGHLGIVT